jgi:signal-transduction protein with cAMP-binding, CBS, and nucleotidyltransferase domain
MLNNLNREIYNIGDIIFKEGDEGNCAYLIEEGMIEISVMNNDQALLINKIGKGELFGEVALIDHQPRTATAKALENSVLIAIQTPLYGIFCWLYWSAIAASAVTLSHFHNSGDQPTLQQNIILYVEKQRTS